MSIQPPAPGAPPLPPPGSLRCPRCSATIGPEQDWCLECGAPARTRLAQTPNWQLPTVAIAAIVLLASAMFAFAFVKLTDDGDIPASTTPAATTTVPVVPPPVATTPVVPPASGATTPAPAATTPAPGTTTPVPGETPPATTTPGAVPPATTTPAPAATTPAVPRRPRAPTTKVPPGG